MDCDLQAPADEIWRTTQVNVEEMHRRFCSISHLKEGSTNQSKQTHQGTSTYQPPISQLGKAELGMCDLGVGRPLGSPDPGWALVQIHFDEE